MARSPGVRRAASPGYWMQPLRGICRTCMSGFGSGVNSGRRARPLSRHGRNAGLVAMMRFYRKLVRWSESSLGKIIGIVAEGHIPSWRSGGRMQSPGAESVNGMDLR